MNISHIIYSIDNAGGGPSRSVTHLLQTMGKVFIHARFSLFAAQTLSPIINEFTEENCKLHLLPTDRIGRLKDFGNLEFSKTQLFHGQAVWDLPVHQMAKLARKKSIPYIITPRGMLEPWSLNQKKWKKKIALALYQYKDLNEASCLHATAQMEADNLRNLGLKNPIAIIPNGVPIQDFEIKEYANRPKQRKLLFLSRIHKKKGLELLIGAWKKIPVALRQNHSIEIIGNGEASYIQHLQSLIISSGLQAEIFIKAPIYGKAKLKAYQGADLFVLPTYSENFGIVIAEALAAGTPVITTKGAPWEDLVKHQCGWHIEIGEEPLREALIDALQRDDSQLELMGKNGRKLIEEKYAMEAVAKNMYDLYAWLMGKREKPEFVRID